MILYTSDTDISGHAAKTAFIYLLTAMLCALFGAVYELFSHEVYSFYMIYAFVFPLAGGVFPFLLLCVLRIPRYPNIISGQLWHSGIAAFTVGCIIRGILDIYGTTNSLSQWYWYIGIFLTAAGLISFLQQK